MKTKITERDLKLLDKLPEPKLCEKCGVRLRKNNFGVLGISPKKDFKIGYCCRCIEKINSENNKI